MVAAVPTSTAVGLWIVVAITALANTILLTQSFLSPSRLRYAACLAGWCTLALTLTNTLRTYSMVANSLHLLLYSIFTLFYIDLSCFIFLDLGTKFYMFGAARNAGFWVCIGMMTLFSLVVLVCLGLSQGDVIGAESTNYFFVAEMLLGVASALSAVIYCFHPLITSVRRRKAYDSDGFAIGAWYFVTIFSTNTVFLLFYAINLAMGNPWSNVNQSVDYMIRMLILCCYALPPPPAALYYIRRSLFPRRYSVTVPRAAVGVVDFPNGHSNRTSQSGPSVFIDDGARGRIETLEAQ